MVISSFRLFALICFACSGVYLPVYAQELAEQAAEDAQQTQTLQSVLSQTYLNNPTIMASRAELRSVQERLNQAYANWLPSINAGASITNSNNDFKPSGGVFGQRGSTDKALDIELDQSIYRGGRNFAEVRAAKNVIRSQLEGLHSVEQSQLLSAVEAYMNVYRDRSVLELAENNRIVIKRQLEATRDRFDVGELTRTDVSQAESRFANAQADVITAEGDLRASEAVFEQVIGFRPENLEYPYVAFEFPDNLYDAIQVARQESPQILASYYTQKASEDDVDTVFGELLPEVSFSGGFQRIYDPQPGRFTEQTTRTVGLTASIPIYQGGDTRSRVRQSKFTANQRMLQVREQERLVKQSVIQAWENLNTARAEINARKAQVDASKVAQEGVRAEADYGARTVLDTLDADQELLDAEVAFVTAQRNKVVAEYSLLNTLGRLSPDVLGFEKDQQSYDLDWRENHFNLFNTNVDRLTP